VDDDGLPAETESLISEELRQRGIDVLQGLLADGKVDLERFQIALDGLLRARTYADFATVVRSLPPPVPFTPAARRRQEPLVISTSMGDVRLKGRWQVGRLTKIGTGMGAVTIDLTEAEFDDWDVEIVVDTGMGSITVIAPRGLDVRQVDALHTASHGGVRCVVGQVEHVAGFRRHLQQRRAEASVVGVCWRSRPVHIGRPNAPVLRALALHDHDTDRIRVRRETRKTCGSGDKRQVRAAGEGMGEGPEYRTRGWPYLVQAADSQRRTGTERLEHFGAVD
jgi:hypothetical protein